MDRLEYEIKVEMVIHLQAEGPGTALNLVLSALDSNVPGTIIHRESRAEVVNREPCLEG